MKSTRCEVEQRMHIEHQNTLIKQLHDTIYKLMDRNNALERRCDLAAEKGIEFHKALLERATRESELESRFHHLKSLYISLNNKYQEQLSATERFHRKKLRATYPQVVFDECHPDDPESPSNLTPY